MQSVLLILQLIVAVALIITVLLQRSEGGALGIGGSGSGLGGMFSARGAANTLTQTTAFLAAAFFIISIVLNVLTLRGVQTHSILDTSTTPAGTPITGTINLPARHPAGPQPQSSPQPAPQQQTPAPQKQAPAPKTPTVPPSH
jgi:preprotein translocase subunit SecG